jgi:hypothetical protein
MGVAKTATNVNGVVVDAFRQQWAWQRTSAVVPGQVEATYIPAGQDVVTAQGRHVLCVVLHVDPMYLPISHALHAEHSLSMVLAPHADVSTVPGPHGGLHGAHVGVVLLFPLQPPVLNVPLVQSSHPTQPCVFFYDGGGSH